MREIIFAILLTASFCSDCRFNTFRSQIPISNNNIGCLESKYNGISFLQYFYDPENIPLYVNDIYQFSIVKLEGNGDFALKTNISTIPGESTYNGEVIKPKEIPFYFLRLNSENQRAVISLSKESRTAHIRSDIPLTYQIYTSIPKGNYRFSLRGDDISMVESVYFISIDNTKGKSVKTEIKIEADEDNVFSSPILKFKINVPEYLEIKINKGNGIPHNYENYLLSDIYFADPSPVASEIDNKPQYFVLGEVFNKKTQINSFDDFLIEFPEEFVEVKKITLSNEVPESLIDVVVGQGRIHVSFRSNVENIESYEIEVEFVVKRLPKVSNPILIARYNIEELRSTEGFVIKGSYYDNKIFFKASPEAILSNNVYFSFKNAGSFNPEQHQISIGYDALPSSDFTEFYLTKEGTQIVKLEVEKERARRSSIIIIALRRTNKSSRANFSTLSYYEVKVTKNIYKMISRSGEIVEYSLKKGQSLNIINYGLYQITIPYHGYLLSQEYLLENREGKISSHIRKIRKSQYSKIQYSSLDSLFTYENKDNIGNSDYKKITFALKGDGGDDTEDIGSILKITALTDEVSGSIITGQNLEEKKSGLEERFAFLN